MIKLFHRDKRSRMRGKISVRTPSLLKASRYNFFVNSDDKFVIAFNAMSRAVGRFSLQQYKIVKEIIQNPSRSVSELPNGISIKRYLLQGGFLISSIIDEFILLRKRNELAREKSDSFELILVPTMDCNFRCTYCYETHRPQRIEKEVEKAFRCGRRETFLDTALSASHGLVENRSWNFHCCRVCPIAFVKYVNITGVISRIVLPQMATCLMTQR
jgi:hypothetical protein